MGLPDRIIGLVGAERLLEAKERLQRPVEKVIAARLEREVMMHPRPRAIGVIMDGNRRWATTRGEQPWMGHRHGKRKVRELVQWCKKFDIRGLVLYAFSSENFNRRREEVDEIMNLVRQGFDELAADPTIIREGIRVRVIGRRSLLPDAVQQSIRTAEDLSRENRNYDLTFAIAYGGRDEIVDAARAIAEDVHAGRLAPSEVDEAALRSRLYAPDIDDPDLIIRTSGEQRLSNFLPWQAVYAELHFSDSMWPSFSYVDFLKALQAYQRRERRIGR